MSIGWTELGDLTQVGSTREEFKAAMAAAHPDAKPAAIAGGAGVPFRFAYEVQVGDVVVAPYRPDGTVNIGVVSGPYYYVDDAPTHPHRRGVRWQKLGIPRSVISQPALYEIGSAITLFRVRKHVAEFLAVLNSAGDTVEAVSAAVESVQTEEPDDVLDEPRASRIERHTRDFVLERLKDGLIHREFEEFTADLQRAIGYQARVTQFSQDGGVDIIAHRDPLGVEPPLIKVQCKHHTGTISAPEVQQLVGTQALGELSLYVTLGNYSRDAQSIERQRQGLRLINGEALVDLFLANYAALPPSWRTRIPLTQLLVVDDAADE